MGLETRGAGRGELAVEPGGQLFIRERMPGVRPQRGRDPGPQIPRGQRRGQPAQGRAQLAQLSGAAATLGAFAQMPLDGRAEVAFQLAAQVRRELPGFERMEGCAHVLRVSSR